MSDAYETLRLEVADFVATVTLDRPPVNAMNRAMREEIVRVFDELHDRPDVRAVVLTAAGKAFCAGADLKERPGIAGEHGAYPRHNRLTRAVFDSVMECGKPVIAAVNGLGIGAGCVLALCADIILWRRTPICR
jgi:enoyl-CoA hydratase